MATGEYKGLDEYRKNVNKYVGSSKKRQQEVIQSMEPILSEVTSIQKAKEEGNLTSPSNKKEGELKKEVESLKSDLANLWEEYQDMTEERIILTENLNTAKSMVETLSCIIREFFPSEEEKKITTPGSPKRRRPIGLMSKTKTNP